MKVIDRQLIIELRKSGKSTQEVMKITGASKTSVCRLVQDLELPKTQITRKNNLIPHTLLENERWVEPKRYYVNDQGIIVSLITNKSILTPQVTHKGYHAVLISFKTGVKTCSVHRLVAKAFIPNPENKPQVNHLNGVKTDNRLVNLEWCTNLENIHHAYTNNLVPVLKAEAHYKASISNETVLEIIEMIKTTLIPLKEIAAQYNIRYEVVKGISAGKSWRSLYQGEAPCTFRPDKVNNSKMDRDKDIELRKLHSEGWSVIQLAAKFGIGKTSVRNVLSRPDRFINIK